MRRSPLVLVAERANPKRSFLLVSTVLGKHLPVSATRCRLAGMTLGLQVAQDPRAWAALDALSDADEDQASDLCWDIVRRPAVTDRPTTVIGFAETATGLAEQVATALDAEWLQTTTRHRDGGVGLPFAETHSHAPEQWVIPPPGGWPDGPLVLVDDELSTGATAANLIDVLHAHSPRDRYVVAALVDSRPAGLGPLERWAQRHDVSIDVVALQRRAAEPRRPAGWSAGALPRSGSRGSAPPVLDIEVTCDAPRQHHGQNRQQRRAFAELAGTIAVRTGNLPAGALILGTGEHLALAQNHATHAAALTSSTTRSPVFVSSRSDYPISHGLAFSNPEGRDIPGYAYNVRASTRPAIVIHLPDAEHRDRADPLLRALAHDGGRQLITVTLR